MKKIEFKKYFLSGKIHIRSFGNDYFVKNSTAQHA